MLCFVLQVHAAALKWEAAGELEIMKHLAALIVHAADLGNGADEWSVSRLWAQWCNAGERQLQVTMEMRLYNHFTMRLASTASAAQHLRLRCRGLQLLNTSRRTRPA
jgi:hypothetical protein